MEIQNLSQISESTIQEVYNLITELVQEEHPDIDTRRGVISELVFGLDAIVMAAQLENTRLVNQSQSIASAQQSSLLDDSVIDAIASNYRITRRSASYASGELVIVLNSQTPLTIVSGTEFTANGVTFTADDSYSAKTDASQVILNTDRLLVQYGSNYYFTINVTATTAGEAGNIAKNVEFTWEDAPDYFVKAYAADSFTGGIDAQTNDEIIDLILSSMSTKAWANRPMIENLIRNADSSYTSYASDFANIQDISIIGGGDPEMKRDQHWIFPISGGGRIDLYVRSQKLPILEDITKEGTFSSGSGTWNLSIGRDDAPGLYKITEIRPASAPAGEDIRTFSESRSYDIGGDVYAPDVQSAIEAAFSRFQTISVTNISEPDPGSYSDGEKQNFAITIMRFPLIKEIQEYIGNSDIRTPCGDCLVRAAIPCFVSLTVNLVKQTSSATIDENSIKQALMNYVNSLGFSEYLYASGLSNAIAPLLTDIDINTISMEGELLKPDLSTTSFGPSTDYIEISEDYSLSVSGNTVVFILQAEDITINLT